jgi:hypothetical protein
MNTRCLALWFRALPIALCLHTATAAAADAGGVTVSASFTPHASEPGLGELTFELRDTATAQPLEYGGRRLAGWLQRSPKTLADGELACSDKVRALASQGIGRRAAVDFNTYSLVTVNDDRTVAFINPFLGLNNAKLEAVVRLPGDVTAQLHHPRAHELWIAMREADVVVVVDTDTQQIKRSHVFAAGSAPQALALAGSAVWVAFGGRDQWLRFDGGGSEVPDQRVEAQPTTRLAASPDGRHLIGLHARGFTVFETADAATLHTRLPDAPVDAAWSELAQRWLVTATAGPASGRLYWVDAGRGHVESTTDLAAPASALIALDVGRHAVALMTNATAAVIDVATPQVVQTVRVVPGASELASSAAFVYAHSPTRGAATLFSLADARAGRASPIDIAIGTPGAAAGASGALGLAANTPDGSGMLLANASDGQVYQYAEGMMAPIGSFSNYRRSARALVLVNHGFEPVGAGRYRATVRHATGGAHELVLSGVAPRFANCLKIALPDVPDAKREALAARPHVALMGLERSRTGDTLRVHIRLEDSVAKTPLGHVPDLILLAFDKRSGWQRRLHLVEGEPGRYSATLSASASSPTEAWQRLELLVSSATQDMPFGAGWVGVYDRSAR